ncbi:MAG: hypothetical protein HZY76_03450 [Anaerolineae bacterium]|nr:MAG: hypothetical protein HZY76_03450 [Anaerolineae bacterium]
MARYRYNSVTARWDTLSIEDAWAAWDQQYAGAAGEDANVAAGKLAILQLYYLSLSRGWARPVQFGGVMVNDPSRATSDEDLRSMASTPVGLGRLANLLIVNQLVLTYYTSRARCRPIWASSKTPTAPPRRWTTWARSTCCRTCAAS